MYSIKYMKQQLPEFTSLVQKAKRLGWWASNVVGV